MKNPLRILTAGFVLPLLLISCNGSKSGKQEQSLQEKIAKDTTTYNKLADYKFFYALANLPSPLEIINTVYGTNVEYNKSLINPDNNVDKYLTSCKKSLNYGVYGVDLAYIGNYGKNQDLINYYLTAKKLAEDLGVEESFTKFTDRFKANEGNRDSLIRIIDMAYAETDKYMKSNERLLSSSQVLAGSFGESIYLSLMLLKDSEGCIPCKAVFESIYRQKATLTNLIELLKQFKNDKETAQVLADLESFKVTFDEIKTEDDMNKQSLNKIAEKIAIVRNNMIK
jgi:hypothetical protein